MSRENVWRRMGPDVQRRFHRTTISTKLYSPLNPINRTDDYQESIESDFHAIVICFSGTTVRSMRSEATLPGCHFTGAFLLNARSLEAHRRAPLENFVVYGRRNQCSFQARASSIPSKFGARRASQWRGEGVLGRGSTRLNPLGTDYQYQEPFEVIV